MNAQDIENMIEINSTNNDFIIDIDIESCVVSEEKLMSSGKKHICSGVPLQICEKLCAGLFICGFITPFVGFDLYFAFTDESCIHQTFDKIHVNMFIYLIVSGLAGIVYAESMSFVDFVYDFEKKYTEEYTNIVLKFCTICQVLFNIFSVSWTMIGCIIFWGYMDNLHCSRTLYNYLFAKFVVACSITSIVLLSKNTIKGK